MPDLCATALESSLPSDIWAEPRPILAVAGLSHIDDALRRERGRTVLYLKRKIILIPPDIAANVELQKNRCNESL